MDCTFVHKIWEKSISTNVGSGQPLKTALLINYDPNAPSRLMSTIAEQEGIKADPTEMCELVSFVKRNKLQTESFVIGQNQYLVTSIHESWFCARCMSTSKPSGEGAILMHTGAFLLIGFFKYSFVGSASQLKRSMKLSYTPLLKIKCDGVNSHKDTSLVLLASPSSLGFLVHNSP